MIEVIDWSTAPRFLALFRGQLPSHTDAFQPDVGFVTLFRLIGTPGSVPVASWIDTFTALDIIGEPITGVVGADVYVGGNRIAPHPETFSSRWTSEGVSSHGSGMPPCPMCWIRRNGVGFNPITLLRRQNNDWHDVYGDPGSPSRLPVSSISAAPWGRRQTAGTPCVAIRYAPVHPCADRLDFGPSLRLDSDPARRKHSTSCVCGRCIRRTSQRDGSVRQDVGWGDRPDLRSSVIQHLSRGAERAVFHGARPFRGAVKSRDRGGGIPSVDRVDGGPFET